MIYKEIEIDFSQVSTLDKMHEVLMVAFKLPDFYGRNVNALIDCLSSLRFPADEMIGIVLAKDQVLEVKTKGLSRLNELCINHFLTSIESVNEREKNRGEIESIKLILT